MPHTPETTQDAPIVFVEADLADAPEWIPLLPTPQVYQTPQYGEVDLSPERVAEYVANFKAGVYGQVLPVDLEHDLPLSGAMAEITDMRTNTDGTVDAQVTWNPRGRQVIAEKRFRYVSPTLRTNWTDPVTLKQHKHVVVGAALTTRPYFKTQSLRPLIAASESVPAGERQEDLPMSETTDKTPVVDVAEFNELKTANADLLRQFSESEEKREAAEAERVKLADEVKAMREEAQDAKFRESLKGCTDVDGRIAELKALPVELHEGYIKRAQAERDARTSGLNFKERGVDAHGEATAKAKLTARAEDIRKADPKLTKELAFSEACRQDADLYRQFKAESQA